MPIFLKLLNIDIIDILKNIDIIFDISRKNIDISR